MNTPEGMRPSSSMTELARRGEDDAIAAAVTGVTFSFDLDMRAGTLKMVLENARQLGEDDPRRGVLALYGQRLLSIVAPEMLQPAEGEQ